MRTSTRTVETWDLAQVLDVNAELADMVATKTDNVIGASKRLGSAWEGLILKFKGSSGVMQSVLDSFANSINTFTNDNISKFDKILFLTGSKQQDIQENFAANLRKGTKEQVEFTISQNEKRISVGGKF